ncbi:hypothetical protein [Aeoliella sp.]|uniref:hypothetical protein n=1 Tax=Aeoliella sp. TaxID=2795800 RepID=UPI003CCC3C9F
MSNVYFRIQTLQPQQGVTRDSLREQHPITEAVNRLHVMVISSPSKVFLLTELFEKRLNLLRVKIGDRFKRAAIHDAANASHGQFDMLGSVLTQAFFKRLDMSFQLAFLNISLAFLCGVDQTPLSKHDVMLKLCCHLLSGAAIRKSLHSSPFSRMVRVVHVPCGVLLILVTLLLVYAGHRNPFSLGYHGTSIVNPFFHVVETPSHTSSNS